MSTHNICFYRELEKTVPYLSSLTIPLMSSGVQISRVNMRSSTEAGSYLSNMTALYSRMGK